MKFTIILLLTFPLFLPTFLTAEVPSCNNINFSENRNLVQENYHGIVGTCRNVSSTSEPTTIHINPRYHDCSYNVTTYSGFNCRNEDLLSSRFLMGGVNRLSATLNDRKPICSLKPRVYPLPGNSISVQFSGGNINGTRLTYNSTLVKCLNLANCEKAFPTTVHFYQGERSISAWIELFSAPNCTDGEKLGYPNGNTNIRAGADLPLLTSYPAGRVAVKSYMIKRALSGSQWVHTGDP